MTTALAPAEIRYIKLGEAGRWWRRSLQAGELHFGYGGVAHEPCLAGDWETVGRQLAAAGGHGGTPKSITREVREFYELGPDCLWITFADGHLWWASAHQEVIWLGGDGAAHGRRMRRCVAGWRKTDLKGRALSIASLSTRLT